MELCLVAVEAEENRVVSVVNFQVLLDVIVKEKQQAWDNHGKTNKKFGTEKHFTAAHLPANREIQKIMRNNSRKQSVKKALFDNRVSTFSVDFA